MATNIYYSDCDFCGQENIIIGTPHGCFCKDCLQLMIDEFTTDIEEIEKYEGENK